VRRLRGLVGSHFLLCGSRGRLVLAQFPRRMLERSRRPKARGAIDVSRGCRLLKSQSGVRARSCAMSLRNPPMSRRKIELIYQGRRAGGVVGSLASSGKDRGHLVPREVTCIQMGTHHGRKKTLLILQFGCYRLLLGTAVGTLLHGGQNPGLLAFGHTAESHRCNQKCINPRIRYAAS